ncbi:hypothetical protein ABI59_06005 [Acidobacteria bacterium Mor1]|nr:hypothetical protein ABI59_06005 [Acidobacteria bacterium Mor1]
MRFIATWLMACLAWIPIHAQTVRQLTDIPAVDPVFEFPAEPFIDRLGVMAAFRAQRTSLVAVVGIVSTDGGPVQLIGEAAGSDPRFFTTNLPALSSDLQTVFFLADRNPICTGENELYRADVNGGNLTRLDGTTGCGGNPRHLDVSATTDVGVIATLSLDGYGLHTVDFDSGSLDFVIGTSPDPRPRIDANGETIASVNADGVFHVQSDGTNQELLSVGLCCTVDIDEQGRYVLVASNDDPVGLNADGNGELFLHDLADDSIAQITDTTTGGKGFPRLSGDARWAYFSSSAAYAGDPGGTEQVYRVDVASRRIERVLAGRVFGDRVREGPPFAVDLSGDRVVVAAQSDFLGTNPDGSLELFFIDFSVPPTFTVGAGSPTELTWSADPRTDTWDIVRGDLSSLAAGAGSDTDLGTVVCVEEGSVDSAASDPAIPAAGQGFFYLRRFGFAADYGANPAGGQRIASSGDCN